MFDNELYNKYEKWVGKNPTQTPKKIAFRNKVKKAIRKYSRIANGKSKRT